MTETAMLFGVLKSTHSYGLSPLWPILPFTTELSLAKCDEPVIVKKVVAERIGCSESTISRELSRNYVNGSHHEPLGANRRGGGIEEETIRGEQTGGF